jgi:hypothetical protein
MTLTEFLMFLTNNPTEYTRYGDNPVAYVQGADLSAAHKTLLLEGSDEEIIQAVNAEAPADPPGTIKVITDSAGPNIKRFIDVAE